MFTVYTRMELFFYKENCKRSLSVIWNTSQSSY